MLVATTACIYPTLLAHTPAYSLALSISVPYQSPTPPQLLNTVPKSLWRLLPNRFSTLERARHSNYNVAVIIGNHHNEVTIRVCRHLSVLIVVEPLATVPDRPNEARLQALHNTRSDDNMVRVSCRIVIEIQQTLTDLWPHGFSTVYDMSHCTESAVAIGYHLRDNCDSLIR